MIAGADGSGSDAGDACAEAVFDAVESVLLGEASVEFSVVGGTALGGSDAGDATIARIMQQAGLHDSKRPCLLCHHLSAWNAVLWVRWLADDAPPFHDDLYLCYPDRAAPGALALSDATRDLCRADLLTKLCQLAHARSVPPLLSHAFRLLAPVLEPSFITLSPFLSSRPGTKKGEYAAHRHVFNAYEAGLQALREALGDAHVAVMRGTCALGGACEAHASELDARLDSVEEGQTFFARAVEHWQAWLAWADGVTRDEDDQGEFVAHTENVRAVRVRMAGALRRMHSPQHIRRAAALYAATGEAALAEATDAEAAAWQM